MNRFFRLLQQLGNFCIAFSFICSGCDVLKLEPALDKFTDQSDTIGMNLAAGLLEGIDTTKLDTLLTRLTNVAGNAIAQELDSLSFQKLEDSLKVAVLGILDESLASLDAFLADPTKFDQLETKLQSITDDLTSKVDLVLIDLIPNALNDQSLKRIYALRDSLLGPTTATLLKNALRGSVEDLLESEQLDNLIKSVSTVVDDTTTKVDESAMRISKTLVTAGIVVASILLALALLFFILWFRKRSLASQQNNLLINLTKAIDAIPTKDDYDQTIDFLQHQLNTGDNSEQYEILQEVLQNNQEKYPQKQKYKAHYERMAEQLKQLDQDGSIRRKMINNSDDDAFKQFIKGELDK